MTSIEDRSSFDGQSLAAGSVGAQAALRLCVAVVALLLIVRAFLAATTNLAEDEAYYWLWSTSLAPGYYDHPPMIAYWVRAGTAIFGQTSFGVRFAGLVSALAGSYCLYRASLSLFQDRKAAALSVIWLNATLLCNAAALIATPDTPLAFFATLLLFTLAKLIETGRGTWWYGIGAALGFAFMSKYTAALLLPGLFLWMIASAEGRRWFFRPEPYLGAVIALLIIAPLVDWNYNHDWVSFAKQGQHGIKDKPANAILSILEFLGGQAGLATPFIFAFCVFGSFYSLLRGIRPATVEVASTSALAKGGGNAPSRGPLLHRARNSFPSGVPIEHSIGRDARWLLLGAMSAPIFAFFFLHAASQKIQPNWPGFIYPAAILAAVHGFLAFSQDGRVRPWIRTCFRLAPWIGICFTLVTFLQLGTGVVPIEAKKDPTSRLKGWAKLGAEVERLERDNGAASILTDRYALTGELAFYDSKPDTVSQINERIRYANLPAPDESKLKNAPALLILRKGAEVGPAAAFFSSTSFLTTLPREAGFHSRDAYDVHLLAGYRGGLFAEPAKP